MINESNPSKRPLHLTTFTAYLICISLYQLGWFLWCAPDTNLLIMPGFPIIVIILSVALFRLRSFGRTGLMIYFPISFFVNVPHVAENFTRAFMQQAGSPEHSYHDIVFKGCIAIGLIWYVLLFLYVYQKGIRRLVERRKEYA